MLKASLPPAPTETVLDGRLINGKAGSAESLYETAFAFHEGVIVNAAAQARTWGTVDASNGYVLPGIISSVGSRLDDELAWCRRGLTTGLLTLDLDELLDGSGIPASCLDIVPVARLTRETTGTQIVKVMTAGISLFDAADTKPAQVPEALDGRTIRVDADSPWLEDWARSVTGSGRILVITGVTPATLSRAQRVKQTQGPSAILEIASDVLDADNEAIWAAVVDGTISSCSMPEAHSPAVLPLLMAAVEEREMLFTRIPELVAGTPARAAQIAGRKGFLRPGMDADAVVVNAQTPGLRKRPQHPGHVNLALRRGQFLFLQEEIHAKPSSGIILTDQNRKDPRLAST